MPTDLYRASVPVFVRYLQRLLAILEAAQAHAEGTASTEQELLGARLATDMLPFGVQVEIAANFALRACYPLAGLGVPDYGTFPATFAGLRSRVVRAEALITALDPQRFAQSGEEAIEDRAGEHLLLLSREEFLLEYALPNFFFHLTSAYAILRHCGVALGKGDFDGYHRYAVAP